MDAVLSKMGRNFIVSSLVPALAFASLSLFVFTPIVPEDVMNLLQNVLAPLDQPGLLLLMITIVIGFSLHSLNTTIYKVLEGYFLLYRIPAFKNFQKRRIIKKHTKIRILEELHKELKSKNAEPADLDKIQKQIYRLSATHQRKYPPSLEHLMPTRFGNAFRAMEVYPRLRYRMDAVLLWPRLIHVIPEEYYLKLDESNNRLAFLVNCALLSLGMSVLSGLAAGYQFLLFRLAYLNKDALYFVDVIPKDIEKYHTNAYLYLAGIVIMMGFFVIFYRASIPIVVQYGELVKSAFDLFRAKLIKEMALKSPNHFRAEINVWENLSLFIGYGLLDENYSLIPFHYDVPNNMDEDDGLEIVDGLELLDDEET